MLQDGNSLTGAGLEHRSLLLCSCCHGSMAESWFYMVNYIAGIIAVPGELLEAARIDGATSFQVFRKITIPMIMPAISICMLTSMTFAFKLFDIIMVFTKGGPANSTVSVAYNIYKEAFVNSKYGLATAKSLVFVVFVLIITAIQMKITKSKEVEA